VSNINEIFFEEVVLQYVDCICLAVNVDCWWAVLKTLMKHSFL